MAASTQISLNEYLHTSYEPEAEYVDGDVEKLNVGEYDHTSWQQAIERWFLQYLIEWNIRVRLELRVQVSLTRFRIPDVVVFDRDNPIEQILTRPPIAVFEVLTPEDRISRMLVKLDDYERMGIPTIRVVDPKTKAIYRFENGALEPIAATLELLPGRSAGSIDWDSIRSLLD